MRKTILVVEDDAAIGEVLQLMLSDAGYAVEIQMDGLSGTDGRAMCQYLKGPVGLMLSQKFPAKR